MLSLWGYSPAVGGQRAKIDVGAAHSAFTGLKTVKKQRLYSPGVEIKRSEFHYHFSALATAASFQPSAHNQHHHCLHHQRRLSNDGLISTHPPALPEDRRLGRVVEAELVHTSQGDHHPWGGGGGDRYDLHHKLCSSYF